jgi:hypothetical protein
MWIPLTVADVLTRLAGAEVAALRSAALATGQDDPTPEIIVKVVKECRGRLRNQCRLEVGDTVPDNWAHHCLAIVRHRLCTRLPGAQFLTAARQREYEDAIAAFQQLGPILPDEPDQADPTLAARAPAPDIAPRVRQFTAENQDGL